MISVGQTFQFKIRLGYASDIMLTVEIPIGKVYKGSGDGGGLYTEMKISFLDNHKCICVSDWCQAYSSPKSIKGNYEVKNNQVVVNCKDNDGKEYKFEFDIKSNGRVIEFNHSDPEMGGTMGNDFMSLEIQ